jgi:hypothetical protein
MNLQVLQQKLPEVKAWIDGILSAHAAQSRSVASLAFPRLGSYYSPSLLASAQAIPVAHVPAPPLASMGLTGFDEFENLDSIGITFLSSFFVRHGCEQNESLHFHELVHVIQWQYLGPDKFIMAYALGHLLSGGYYANPLEEMAYRLQGRFDRREPAFDVATLVRHELDIEVPALFRTALGPDGRF